MKTTLNTKQETASFTVRDFGGSSGLLVVSEDYKDTSGKVEIPAGTVVVSIWGNFSAFLPDGQYRFWSTETQKVSPYSLINLLKFRKALPGEGVTISA